MPLTTTYVQLKPQNILNIWIRQNLICLFFFSTILINIANDHCFICIINTCQYTKFCQPSMTRIFVDYSYLKSRRKYYFCNYVLVYYISSFELNCLFFYQLNLFVFIYSFTFFTSPTTIWFYVTDHCMVCQIIYFRCPFHGKVSSI